MNESFIELSGWATALIPVVIGLTQVTKGYVNDKHAPLVALVWGLIGAFLIPDQILTHTTYEMLQANILEGVLIGLSAAGLYSGTKTLRATA